MGKVVKDLFGGSDDSAQRAQQSANEATQRFIEQQAGQARQDVLGMYPQTQETRRQGFQQAIDVFGQATPEQARLYEQGNLAAQQQGFRGQADFANAILGLGTGMTQYQPQSMQPNFSWMSQQLAPIQAAGQSQQGADIFNPSRGGTTQDILGGWASATPYRTPPTGFTIDDYLAGRNFPAQPARGAQWR